MKLRKDWNRKRDFLNTYADIKNDIIECKRLENNLMRVNPDKVDLNDQKMICDCNHIIDKIHKSNLRNFFAFHYRDLVEHLLSIIEKESLISSIHIEELL